MALWRWSKTAATNASAEPTINFAEGQLPSTLNDSARAVMADVAKWRDDISGAALLGGSDGVNYTLTTNSGYPNAAAMDGQLFAFTPQVTNTGSVTINVDSVGAFGLRSVAAGAAGDLPSGALVAGTPYLALFNNANSKFFLINTGFQTYSVPVGGLIIDGGDTPPNSCFANPMGQALSRTTYATLYARYGTKYGAGDGSTTFNIQDLRGRVVAGYDPSNATGRLTAALSGVAAGTLGSAGGTQNQSLTAAHLPPHAHSGTTGGMNANNPHSHAVTGAGYGGRQSGQLGSSGIGAPYDPGLIGIGATDINHGHAFTTDNGPGTSAGLIMIQPTLVQNYLVRII